MGIMDTQNLGINVADIALGINLNWTEFAIRKNIFGVDKKIYGVSWYGGSNPILTRTDDAVGMVANVGVDSTPVANDFDSVPYFTKITTVTDAYGNKFRRFPKLYINKTATGAVRTLQISEYPHVGYYLPYIFWDFANSKELAYVDIACYKANLSTDTTKLESKAGKYPLTNKNIVEFRTLAQANGAGYQIEDVHSIDFLTTLYRVEFATLDQQTLMIGFVNGRYTDTDLAVVTEANTNRVVVPNATAAYYAVGQTISVGTSQGGNQVFYGRTITNIDVYDASNKAITFDGTPVNIATGNRLYNTGQKSGINDNLIASSGSFGSNSSGLFPCSYRGVESPWGDLYRFIDGVNINDNQSWICKDSRNYASNVFASPYEQVGFVNSNANNYVKEMGFDSTKKFAEFPTNVSGGSYNIYYGDYYYQSAGQRISLVGGFWSDGRSAGSSVWYLSSSSGFARVSIGARLLKKPL